MPGAVVLLMGRSFSGKSTVASVLAQALPAQVLSYDAINVERGLHGGRGIPVEEWLRTDSIARARAAELLDVGGTVVIDDTSSPRFLRDGWRRRAAGSRARFLLVFIDVPPEVVRTRLRGNRESAARADVIDSVMADHLEAFEPPAADEPHIRFDDSASSDVVIAAVRAGLEC